VTGRHGYEFFDHTADVGAVVRGATLARLFENAGCALADLICDRRTVRPRRRVRIAVEGEGIEDLLVRFLSQLLYLHDTAGWLFCRFRVEKVDRRGRVARGWAWGEPADRGRHALQREIKAVTYHQIRLVRGRSAWRVRIVFDI
jgi:SHS2 domain-containing protein